MQKKMCIVLFLTFLLILVSCKQKETTEIEESTNDLFDDVLSNTPASENTQEIETTEALEETTAEEETVSEETDSEDEEEYAPPSCGDAICTYYETFSFCPDDCEKLEETTLYDYPDFLDDPILVVGDDAPSTDVITATVISTYLVSHDISPTTKLASEITDFYAQDLILIGSPCENDAIATLLHYTSETCKDIITGMNNAVIKLLVFDSNEIILITGYDNGDTKDASKMLTSDTAYNLNGAEEWINLASDGEINIYFSKN